MANFFDQFDAPAQETDGRSPLRITVYPQGGEPPPTQGNPAYADAIASIESRGSGDYRALGPTTRSGDRAFGRYQVMGQNVGPWTKEILGREMKPHEFLMDPEAQDAVFHGKFGSYASKYGPEGAARAWFAGEGGMNDPNRRDMLGTSVADYGAKFSRALGEGGVTDMSAQSRAPAAAPVVSRETTPPAGNFFDQFDQPATPEQGPQKPDMGRMSAFLTAMRSGVTGNFSDELAGVKAAATAGMPLGGASIPSLPGVPATEMAGLARLGYEMLTGQKGAAHDAYQQAVNAERGQQQTAKEQYPGTALTGEVAGSFALPAGGLARGAGWLAKAGRAAAVGAGYGGLAGAGEGEGLADRASRAATGGALGGAIGGVASPLLDLAAPVAGTAAREAGRYLFPSVDARAAGAIQGAIRSAERTDPRMVGRLTPAEVAANPAATAAELGGEQGRGLARWAANASPEARDILSQMTNDRYEGQTGRIVGWLNRTFHFPDARAQQEALDQTRKQVNNVNYDRAMREGSGGLWSPELQHLAGSDAVSGAMQAAAKSAKDEAIVSGQGAFNPRITFTPDGRMQIARGPTGVPTYPDLQFWDLVRRELSDAAQRAGYGTSEARRLNSFANSLNAALDKLVPSYQQARAGHAHFKGAENALDAGREAVNRATDARDVRQQLALMSPTERRLFQDGFVSEYVSMLTKVADSRNVLNKIAESPNATQKLQAVLGTVRANEMEAMLRVEKIMQMTRVAQQGNSTTARQLAEMGLATSGIGLSTYYHDPYGAAQSVLFGALAARGRGTDRRVAQRVAEMLTSRDPAVLQRGLQAVARNQGFMNGIRALDRRIAASGAEQVPTTGVLPAMQGPVRAGAQDEQQ